MLNALVFSSFTFVSEMGCCRKHLTIYKLCFSASYVRYTFNKSQYRFPALKIELVIKVLI